MKRLWPAVMLSALAGLTPLGVGAQTPDQRVGPALSAASNLSQGRPPGFVGMVQALGIDHLRDGMNWDRVEARPGMYAFDDIRTNYLRTYDGLRFAVALNWGNALYDQGDTPHSADALAAFGRFAAALVSAHPNIDALEIGNEINGINFVKGPLREMAPLERARAYAAMLVAGARTAKAARPDIRILGGATHSLPGAFLWEVMDHGGADVMDAVVVHPYTSRAEELVRQIAVLRRHPALTTMPFEVTEFGTKVEAEAAAHFVKQYCQMAIAGVTLAAWYPFNPRGDGLVPLVRRDAKLTEAGRAFVVIQDRMEGRAVQDLRSDPFVYGCQFGTDTQVL